MIYLLDVQVRPAIAGLASSAQKVDKVNTVCHITTFQKAPDKRSILEIFCDGQLSHPYNACYVICLA